jgi:hypothetical protein
MSLSWTRGTHEPPRHTEVDAESCRNEPTFVSFRTWEQRGNNNAQTPGKAGE